MPPHGWFAAGVITGALFVFAAVTLAFVLPV